MDAEIYGAVFAQSIATIGAIVIAVYSLWHKRDTTRAEAQEKTSQAYLGMVSGMAQMSEMLTTGYKEREDLTQRVNKLEDDLQVERNDKSALGKRVGELESIVTSNKDQIEGLIKERDQLRNEIDSIKADRVTFEGAKEKEVGELLDKIKTMEAQIAVLEAQVQAVQTENRQLRAELSKYEQDGQERLDVLATVGPMDGQRDIIPAPSHEDSSNSQLKTGESLVNSKGE